MRICTTIAAFLFGLVSAWGVSTGYAASATPHFSLGLGVDYARGDYGTDSTSTYTTIPLTLNWYPSERINMELTVPYLNQSTSNTGYAASGAGGGAGRFYAGSGSANPGISAGQSYGGGRGMTGSAQGTAGSSSEHQSGLGDITLLAAYNVLLDGAGSPQLGLTCYLKFPTADEDKGLGTGAFDWGPGLQLSKWLGDWQPFAEGRYIFQGASREEIGARDYLFADLGLGYGWSDDLYTAIFSRCGSANFDGMSAPWEVRLKTRWAFGESTSTEFYLLSGLSDGSPDFGGGIAFFADF